MAILAPVTLLLLLGIIDLGVCIWVYNVTAEAAREGGRFAVVHGSLASVPAGPTANDTKVDLAVKSFAFSMDPTRLTVQSTWPGGDNKPGSLVTVTVKYSYTPNIIFGLGTLNLQSSSTMTICH